MGKKVNVARQHDRKNDEPGTKPIGSVLATTPVTSGRLGHSWSRPAMSILPTCGSHLPYSAYTKQSLGSHQSFAQLTEQLMVAPGRRPAVGSSPNPLAYPTTVLACNNRCTGERFEPFKTSQHLDELCQPAPPQEIFPRHCASCEALGS